MSPSFGTTTRTPSRKMSGRHGRSPAPPTRGHQGCPARELPPIRHNGPEENESLPENAHGTLMPIDDRRNAPEKPEASFPMEFAAGPPDLVVASVVNLAELGENRLSVLPTHLEDRRESFQEKDLVLQSREE